MQLPKNNKYDYNTKKDSPELLKQKEIFNKLANKDKMKYLD